jgi:PAS domain-containing protein
MSTKDLLKEIDLLRDRLRESEETLGAIRRGEVDAIVVSDSSGEKVFTLRTAERIYRTIIEEMNEAAATLTEDGLILFCNSAFAEMVRLKSERIVGTSFQVFLPAAGQPGQGRVPGQHEPRDPHAHGRGPGH